MSSVKIQSAEFSSGSRSFRCKMIGVLKLEGNGFPRQQIVTKNTISWFATKVERKRNYSGHHFSYVEGIYQDYYDKYNINVLHTHDKVAPSHENRGEQFTS